MSKFYAELDGIDRVMSKLNKLNNIQQDSTKIVNSLNAQATNAMKYNTAAAGFPNSSQSCTFDMDGGFGEVGYKGKGNFNNWKELWYQHWGYMQYYYGRPLHYKTVVHVGVFDEIRHLTIQDIKPVLERRVQQYIRDIIK